jgi:predicted transposase/invertase (TIGR01784 family)
LRLLGSWKVRMDMGELEGFIEREEIMAFTEAFLALEQASENKGRQEGRQEIALRMLRKQLDLETIAEFTGLTIEQIQQLQSQAVAS